MGDGKNASDFGISDIPWGQPQRGRDYPRSNTETSESNASSPNLGVSSSGLAIIPKVIVPDPDTYDDADVIDVEPVSEYESHRDKATLDAQKGLAFFVEDLIDGTRDLLQSRLFGEDND